MPKRPPPLPSPARPFTIGVEEEYQIVDAGTGALRPRNKQLLPGVRAAIGPDAADTELHTSMIEIGTPVCRTLADVRRELVKGRRAVIDAAARDGDQILAAGTHPFSDWKDQEITPKDRYYRLANEFRRLAEELVIFGCHVHVGLDDREASIHVMNRARGWLPMLLALTANSPFWLGRDTGYASYRTELFRRWPMTGIPEAFEDRADFDRTIQSLVDAGAIDDFSNIYWDLRPNDRFDTLEFRAADVCSTVDEAVMYAGLCRALTRTCWDAAVADEPYNAPRPELLRAATWRAARFGLEGELVDVAAGRRSTAAAAVESFLTHLRPALESAGEWEEVSGLAAKVLTDGNGATRQRAALAAGGDLRAVVEHLARETAAGVAG